MTDPLAKDGGDPIQVEAAGGIVVRRSPSSDVEVLMIHRRGVWDLPKGKLDPGETPAECAVREVEEETGATDVTILRGAGLTLHQYAEDGRKIIKTTWWFLMRTSSETFVPEIREQIEKVEWINWDRGIEIAGYPNLVRHMRSLSPLVRTVGLNRAESRDRPS